SNLHGVHSILTSSWMSLQKYHRSAAAIATVTVTATVKPSFIYPRSRKLVNWISSQDVMLSLSGLDQPFNQSLTTYQNAQTELIKPELEQIKALLRKVKVKSDQMMHLQSEMLRMQATMIKMQLEPKDEKMDELQCYGRPKRKTMKCLN
ncbi:hypothetical protein BX616_006994, partial [Lobosporangium transversale]